MLFTDFFSHISLNSLKNFQSQFQAALQSEFFDNYHGEFQQWVELHEQLPLIKDSTTEFGDTVTVTSTSPVTTEEAKHIESSFRALHPWRKGPYQLYDMKIDTEWRSDWKWQRLREKILPLKDKMVLDVGCGNGYHCWRMLEDQARFILGIDPSQKFLAQFLFLKKYIGLKTPVYLLPLKSEDLPASMEAFDTVFSMGVLYHRRSPFDHLAELKDALKPGGQLVLETLVVEGETRETLVPIDRYAQMRNVWFIPTIKSLQEWLERAGFNEIQLVDCTKTSTQEQRKTDWMSFHSLADFLDPHNSNKTVEGYPAPLRAILTAIKPS